MEADIQKCQQEAIDMQNELKEKAQEIEEIKGANNALMVEKKQH